MRVAGLIRPPGDKSITHRALVLAALASEPSEIKHCLTSLDARSMASVLRRLGVRVTPLRDNRVVRVGGRGLAGLRQSDVTLNCGNSGTTARLLLGILAARPFTSRVSGDASLRRRPMRRVTRPLTRMGATFVEQDGDGLPVVVTGGSLRPLEYRSPHASAQVKSSLILAGLAGRVSVTVIEPGLSRDHTEGMLAALGVPVARDGLSVQVDPVTTLPGFSIQVPGDPSSAAFMVAAGLLADQGELAIDGISINATRTGFLRVLERMGADIEVSSTSQELGEPVGNLVVRPSRLKGTEVTEVEAPSLIDEVPILAAVASRAEGETVFRGLGELRIKESDRLRLIAENLRRIGGVAELNDDVLLVNGGDSPPRGLVETAGDHRLAMAFAILGTLRNASVRLSEDRSPLVSYPNFFIDLEAVLHRA